MSGFSLLLFAAEDEKREAQEEEAAGFPDEKQFADVLTNNIFSDASESVLRQTFENGGAPQSEHMNMNSMPLFSVGLSPLKLSSQAEIGRVDDSKRKRYAKQDKPNPPKRSKQTSANNASSDLDTVPEYISISTPPGRLGLRVSFSRTHRGARVIGFNAQCALKGQLKLGDAIVAVDGVPVTSGACLTAGAGRARRLLIAREIKES